MDWWAAGAVSTHVFNSFIYMYMGVPHLNSHNISVGVQTLITLTLSTATTAEIQTSQPHMLLLSFLDVARTFLCAALLLSPRTFADQIVYLDRENRTSAGGGYVSEPFFNPNNITASVGELVHFIARYQEQTPVSTRTPLLLTENRFTRPLHGVSLRPITILPAPIMEVSNSMRSIAKGEASSPAIFIWILSALGMGRLLL
jgi:hypothetical protein